MNRIHSIPWIFTYVLIMSVAAAWIWLSKAPPGATTDGEIPAPQVGFQAPDFSLQNAEGKLITLSELRGTPVVINIWASWCAPCRAEMPAMQRVYLEYHEQGLTILAVNATHQDDPVQALDFVDDYQLTFPILFDERGQVSSLYEVRAMPTTFFVNPQGIIQDVVVGGPMSEALLRIRIAELLTSGTGEP
jgi:cytochrome c biogenesis protein CcmG/thiol:disulfide interchange protein DsbE